MPEQNITYQKLQPLTPNELNKHHFGEMDFHINHGRADHLFHFNRLEDVVDMIKFPLPPHRKTVFDFLFITQGQTSRAKGLQEFEFGKNTFFFLPAFQISTHKYMSKDAQGFFCHFSAELFENSFVKNGFLEEFHFLQFSGEPLVEIPQEKAAVFCHLFEQLENAYLHTDKFEQSLIISYLSVIFYEILKIKENSTSNQKIASELITEKYKKLLSKHIYSFNRVNQYAELLSISSDHLNKSVKKTLNKTAQELLLDMIILEAKVLLRQTELSISEIAHRFSGANPSDFSRFFKSKTNLTPKEYRMLFISA